MANKKDPTLCVTCKTQLPPETELHYFTRESMYPTRDDTGFCEEVRRMIAHMEALFTAIAFGKLDDFEEKGPALLGELGLEVAEEALRRIALVQEMENSLWIRWDELRKRLGEEEVA